MAGYLSNDKGTDVVNQYRARSRFYVDRILKGEKLARHAGSIGYNQNLYNY